VYNVCAAGIVDNVMEGFNGTVFAYGQTGAGKSFTMEGAPDPPELRGIIPNSFKHIFDKISNTENKQYLVRASYLEIYNEEIRDLLSKDPKNRLDLKENADSGVYVKDLTSFVVKSSQEIDQVMQAGKKNRSVGSTLMNQESSRSHSIFTIIVECQTKGIDGEDHICVGKLNLVDLAGSERQSKTGATGDRLKEATKINLSLSALGNVINALVDGKSQHIPYRDSKLTRLLQDSLGGNTKTVMIANCGPADYNYDETLSTLRYANRAKNIKNKPKINEDPKDAMLRQFQDEINRLKKELEARQQGKGPMPKMKKEMVDGKEVYVPEGAEEKVEKEYVEVKKVVEKIVIENTGIGEEDVRMLEERAEAERKTIEKKAKAQMKAIRASQEKVAVEQRQLQEEIKKQEEHAAKIKEEEKTLNEKLKKMEEKLIQGGKMIDRAKQQEMELEAADRKLKEVQRQEMKLARELAEREEKNVMMEQEYTSMQEEAEAKSKKLKKLWTMYQRAKGEVKDLQQEFNREREDMLETIRELSKNLKLKELVLDFHVPPQDSERLESKSIWNDQNDTWTIPNIELAGNRLRPNQKKTTSSGKRAQSARRDRSSREKRNPKQEHDAAFVNEYDEYVMPDHVRNFNPYLNYSTDEQGYVQAPNDPMYNHNAVNSNSRERSTPKNSRPSSSRKKKDKDRPESSKERSKDRPQSSRRREKKV